MSANQSPLTEVFGEPIEIEIEQEPEQATPLALLYGCLQLETEEPEQAVLVPETPGYDSAKAFALDNVTPAWVYGHGQLSKLYRDGERLLRAVRAALAR